MIKSGIAMLDVLASWGVDHIYGIPGGSINSTMDALFERRDSMRYIQVRHEEVGALAASADAKLTGKIGVCFGSAGPGATHLFNGLYDAQMDHAPVLALIGQVASGAMNTDGFQELNENPMFADVSVYNRTVMTAQSLPSVVDEAVRRALELKGVAVVTIPVDFGFVDIEEKEYSSAKSHRVNLPQPDPKDVSAALELIKKAERPVLYAGVGARGATDELIAFSEHFSMPVVLSVPAKDILPDELPNLMGAAARLGTKPGNEALAHADLIVFTGSDFPFARYFFPPTAKFIQIDVRPAQLGKRHKTDAALLCDAKAALKALVQAGEPVKPGNWLEANRQNRQNWAAYLAALENNTDAPLRAEAVFKHINRIAKPDAAFMVDVGNTTLYANRLLKLNGRGQRFSTSGLFATMGYGVPGGIAAQLNAPKRQVFTLSGDGGFAMVMQDVLTQVKYKLPVINVVFSNDSLGFIDAEQEDTRQPKYGVDLTEADFGQIGQAMGAKGFTVREVGQLQDVFDQAAAADGPVVIDVKIANNRPFPSEQMKLDPARYSAEEIAAFKKRYNVSHLPILAELLQK